MEYVLEVKVGVESGDVLFGIIDIWFIWNLIGGLNVEEFVYVIDCINVVCIMFMDLIML